MRRGPRPPGRSEERTKERQIRRDFNDFIEREVNRRGVPKEQAQKEVTQGTFAQFEQSYKKEGALGSSDDIFKMFNAALSEQFDAKELAALKKHGKHDPHFRPFSLLPATPQELAKTQDHLESLHEGADIRYSVIADYAELNNELIAVTNRLYGDIDFRSAGSMAEIYANHPRLVADVGRVLEIQQELKRHESNLEKQVAVAEANKRLIEAAKSYPVDGLLNPLLQFFSSAKKRLDSISEGKSLMTFLISGTPAMMGIVFDLVPLAVKTTTATAKLFARGAGAYAAHRRARP